MGHSEIKTTLRYVTVTPKQLDDAISATFDGSGQRVANVSGPSIENLP